MKKSKNKRSQIIEFILITIIMLSFGLLIVEMGANISNELASREVNVATVEAIEMESTPIPTLTADELRDALSAPVGEEGN